MSSPSPTEKALQVARFVADSVPPSFTSAELDLNAGTLSLTFSDTLLASSTRINRITLANRANINQATALVNLTGGTTSQSVDGKTVTIALTSSDLNALKQSSSLATSNTDTFISFGQAVVEDLAGNAATVLSSTAGRSISIVSDNVRPALNSYHLDMDNGRIYLTFSETVSGQTLNVSHIMIQDRPDRTAAGTSFYTLLSSTVSNVNSTVLTVNFLPVDLYSLQAMAVLAVSQQTTFISLESWSCQGHEQPALRVCSLNVCSACLEVHHRHNRSTDLFVHL